VFHLFSIAEGQRKNQQCHCQAYNRESQKNYIHYYELNDGENFNSPSDDNQNSVAISKPIRKFMELNLSNTAGKTTDATRTVPRSAQISANFSI
jgi:hypothetical protein